MTVIVAGYFEFVNAEEVPEVIRSARPHIEGALDEDGCIAYSWTQDHLTPGRVWVYEEWTSSETLSAHLGSHWYRDMGAHLAKFDRKPMTNVIKKYRVDHEEPVYDDTGTARGDFFTA
jgi:quinol monooxygenase YgiN